MVAERWRRGGEGLTGVRRGRMKEEWEWREGINVGKRMEEEDGGKES